MNENMSDMIKQFSNIIQNNEMPDNIKNILNSLKSDSDSGNSSTCNNNVNANINSNNINSNTSDFDSNSEFNFCNIDINTLLKIKSLLESINAKSDDPRANLLKSLKPYLKNNRKDKIDQYIKLFSLANTFEALNNLGGENKNDI